MDEKNYIHVRVTTNAKKETVQKKQQGVFFITVKEKAKERKANKRVHELLARSLGCVPQQLRMIKGATTPSKTYLFINSY